mgnify:FL=1
MLKEYREIRDSYIAKINRKLKKKNKTLKDIKPKNYISSEYGKDDSFEVTTSMTGQVKLIRWLSKQSGTCYCIDIDKDNELNESLGYKYKDIYVKLMEKSYKQLLSRIDEIVV